MTQDRVSRQSVNNLPFFSESDRVREKRSLQKYKFEKAEAERRSKIHHTTADVLEEGAIPVDFKWAEATLEEMRGKKQGRYNTYSDSQKELLISVIQAIRYTRPSHTWSMVAGIVSSQLKVGMTAATASGWTKNISPLVASDRTTNLHFMPDEVGATKNKNKLELRKHAASTYLYYRALKFTAETCTELVNALYGTDVTGKFLRTIDPETGNTKAAKQKENPMMTTDEQITPLDYIYTPPAAAEPQNDITDSQITKLATEIIQKSVDVMNENTYLKERIEVLEAEQTTLRLKVEEEFNETFAEDHEKFITVIDKQQATIKRMEGIIEELKKQVPQTTSVGKENQSLINIVKDLIGGNKKEN